MFFFAETITDIGFHTLSLKEFHISFHNLGQIFRKLRSPALEVFCVSETN
jgi:hypothetical protein